MSRDDDRTAPRRGLLAKVAAMPAWVGLLGVCSVIAGLFFGLPPLVRAVTTPAISEDFALEDAVAALRIEADGTSFLVLVNEEGQARSVQPGDAGYGDAQLRWSQHGLSTAASGVEYVIRDDGISRILLPDAQDLSERGRFITAEGFAVYSGSAQGDRMLFIDAASGELTEVELGHTATEFASCGTDLVMVDDSGVRQVTAESDDLDGLGVFDGVRTLVCDQDRLLGFDEIVTEAENSRQTLRVWDRTSGTMTEHEITYPEPIISSEAGTPFVWEGRLHWTAGYTLWSTPLPLTSGVIEADAVTGPFGGMDGLWPVGSTYDGLLTHAGGRLFGVATDTEEVERRFDDYTRLLRIAIFSADVTTGERRIEIEIDEIDFPVTGVRIHAIAVDPEWAANR